MGFDLVVYGYTVVLRLVSRFSPGFRETLASRDFSMVIRTKYAGYGRCISFTNAIITTFRTKEDSGDFSIVFCDGKTGVGIFSQMARGRTRALGRGLLDGSVSLDGDAGCVTHYLKVHNRMLKTLGISTSSQKKKKAP